MSRPMKAGAERVPSYLTVKDVFANYLPYQSRKGMYSRRR